MIKQQTTLANYTLQALANYTLQAQHEEENHINWWTKPENNRMALDR